MQVLVDYEHAIGHPELQRRGLAMLLDAIPSGQANALDAAYLSDRISVFEGNPQTFGTQFDWDDNGQMSPAPVRDPETLDERRASVGLPPIADSIAEMRASIAAERAHPPADLAKRLLRREWDHLTEQERRVVDAILARAHVSRDTAGRFEASRSVAERLSDGIAAFGGSWTFILLFLGFMGAWALVNAARGGRAFDPYPFVFLNLILSTLAALQAPIIMMSQNRQAERDRLDAAHDYEVNLKAEIEIMALHEKLDEIRHLELLAMRDEIMRIGEKLRSLDGRLPDPAGEAPGAGGGNAGA